VDHDSLQRAYDACVVGEEKPSIIVTPEGAYISTAKGTVLVPLEELEDAGWLVRSVSIDSH
jgi:hypothetical protein